MLNILEYLYITWNKQSMFYKAKQKIICDLSLFDQQQIIDVVKQTQNLVGYYGIDSQAYFHNQTGILSQLCCMNAPVFLDWEINNHSESIWHQISDLKRFNRHVNTIKMITVDINQNPDIVKQAVQTAGNIQLILSINPICGNQDILETVQTVLELGVSGIKCDINDVSILRQLFGDDFKVIVTQCSNIDHTTIKSMIDHIILNVSRNNLTSIKDILYNANQNF